MEPILGGVAAAANGADAIKNGSTASFMADVVDASHDAAVVVDFSAPWCRPCKQPGPALEKARRGSPRKGPPGQIDHRPNPQTPPPNRLPTVSPRYALKKGPPGSRLRP